MQRKLFLQAALALGLALPMAAAQAQAVDVAGVKFEPTLEVGGQRLLLNGAGIRYKLVIKVYAAGLYLVGRHGTTEYALGSPGAKRLHIVALRDIDGSDLGKLFTKGMEQNSTREEFGKSINGVLKIAELFASKKELAKGESFSVDWIPGTGAVVLINDKPTGTVIKEPEFYSALLRIWLGKSPADEQLKDALLGIKKESRRGRE